MSLHISRKSNVHKLKEQFLSRYLNELNYDPDADRNGSIYGEANFYATLDFLSERKGLDLPEFSYIPSRGVVEERLKFTLEEMAEAYKNGDKFVVDDIVGQLAQAFWGLVKKQKNVPINTVESRLPKGKELLRERDFLIGQGIKPRNIASMLGTKFFVTAGHVRVMLNEAKKETTERC